MYIFDTNIFITLKNYYVSIFPSIWNRLDVLASTGKLYSVREVLNEIKHDKGEVAAWTKAHRHIFRDPTDPEFKFISSIFRDSHFQSLIKRKDINQGRYVADPFVIAAAKIHSGIVVTQESFAPNGAKIPNICTKFSIPWLNMEGFFKREKLP